MHITYGNTSVRALLLTLLTVCPMIAAGNDDVCDADPYDYGMRNGEPIPKTGWQDVKAMWDTNQKSKLSHESRTVALGLAWTDSRYFIKDVFKSGNKKGFEVSFCNVTKADKKDKEAQKPDLTFSIWSPSTNLSAPMTPVDVTFSLTEGDFTHAKKANNIWPLLIHRIDQKMNQDEDLGKSLVMNPDGSKFNCEGVVQLPGHRNDNTMLCRVGTLLARLTGQPMKAVKVSHDLKIAEYIKYSDEFPSFMFTHQGTDGAKEKGIKTRIIFRFDKSTVADISVVSPDPNAQEEPVIKDGYQSMDFRDGVNQNTAARWILYPSNYATLPRA